MLWIVRQLVMIQKTNNEIILHHDESSGIE